MVFMHIGWGDMEVFLILLGCFILASLILSWVNAFRISGCKIEIERLRNRIIELEARLHRRESFGDKRAVEPLQNIAPPLLIEGAQSQVEQNEVQNEIEPEPHIIAQPHAAEEDVVFEGPTPRVKRKQDKPNFEFNIAAKLPVWIGSISLIFAAFYLVKYSIEYGLLGPVARVSLGGVFGLILLGIGDYISKRAYISNGKRISQGVIGAGLVALYVSIYASINLYDLVPDFIGFVGMVIVTAMAVILSLRHGQAIAVFGLVGGLLTPALIASDHPSALALFSYLFVLYAALLFVLVRKQWWVLAVMALWGVFGWSALWFFNVYSSGDEFVLILFGVAITAVVLVATSKVVTGADVIDTRNAKWAHGLNGLAIMCGATTIICVALKMQLDLFDWSMFGLFSLALIVLSYFKPNVYRQALMLKVGASLLLFAFWVDTASLIDALCVVGGMVALYVIGTAFLMRMSSDPRFWTILQCVSGIVLYLICYWGLPLPAGYVDAFGMFWGIVSLLLASLAIYRADLMRRQYLADAEIQEHLVAIYAFTASAFITLGIVIELPFAHMPLAIAAQIAASVWIYQRSSIKALQKVIYVLSLIFVGLNYKQLALFFAIIVSSLVGEAPKSIASFIIENPLLNLGVPALLFYLSLSICMKMDRSNEKLLHALFGIANVLSLFTAYYVFRGYFHEGAGHIFSSHVGFIERGFITFTLVGISIAMFEYMRKKEATFLRPWAVKIFRMAIFRFVYFDFILYNPYFVDDQYVGMVPLLNGVNMTYGLGLLAVLWAIKNKDLIMHKDSMHKTYAAIALISIFALVSLNVRQFFHAPYLDVGDIGSTELYSYSVIWMLTGLALLAAGIKFRHKALRKAAMVFIALSVCKVFLIDAAELEGLYRVFSFLGLGVSLIGLSFFYTRFVKGDATGRSA